MKPKRFDLSIIIPTRNEAGTIGECIERAAQTCPEAEIIVVDGGNDDTPKIVESLRNRYPGVRHILNSEDRGKGHAIQVGILESSGSILVQLDADLQFLPEEIPKLIAPLLTNAADMALGSRFTEGSRREKGSVPGPRALGNQAISAYASILGGHRITDILSGIKTWRREVSDSFALTSDTYSYEAELVIKSLGTGWRVVDVPITTCPRLKGKSSVRVVQVGFQLLKDILKFRLRPT